MDKKRLVLPCLRGYMGSWTTYSCMMRLSDVSELIGFADELHTVTKLSDKIQRDLKADRKEEISNYLLENEDRFFNSIVVAVYGGDPSWHDIDGLRPNSDEAKQLEFPEYAEDCLGFLSITKEEKLFALDGQHRLAGIKDSTKKNKELGDELLNVIIVAHSNSPEGKVRSRKLFTTLNKKAEAVSKDEIIALDEDDISACITRELIESDDFKFLNEDNISFSSGQVRGASNITTLVNIYDNIQKLVAFKLDVPVKKLDNFKYKDHKNLYAFIEHFFAETFKNCDDLMKVVTGELIPGECRKSSLGGHMLLRPLGWDTYTDIIISGLNTSDDQLKPIIRLVLSKDLSLSGKCLLGRLYSKSGKIMSLTANNYKKIQQALLED
ncbi:DNA sulfur modification protein DndB [Vibrio alginolyticus]|uniref:DNA sulfur modification protein DndB n=1 Tax=Vibrio alginolyticus TaxID=663 RepID=UPI00374A44C8